MRSCVYRPHGLKSGGSVGNTGNFSNGSPMILRTILNFPGNSPMIGFVFNATGLYFFPVVRLCDAGAICDVRSMIASASVIGGSGMSNIGALVDPESLEVEVNISKVVEGVLRFSDKMRNGNCGREYRLPS